MGAHVDPPLMGDHTWMSAPCPSPAPWVSLQGARTGPGCSHQPGWRWMGRAVRIGVLGQRSPASIRGSIAWCSCLS